MRAFGEEEEAALERGDLNAAVDANVRLWLADGAAPEVRELVADMQHNAFQLQKGHEQLRMVRLEPPASGRLAEVRAPTLVLTGDEDVRDIHEIADKLVAEIPGAERATIAGAGHLPSLERPDEFDRVVLGFLAKHGV
jgi:pimeloyl-ACP methyl ester carboxylesterase